MPWARLMRGSRSKLKTVAPLAGQGAHGVFRLPDAEETQDARRPAAAPATSSALGAFTRTTNPAPASVLAASGATVAPASAKAASLKAASWPAPDWMHDLPARADQLLDHVRHEGDAALSGTGLGGDRQFHGCSV